MQLASWLLLHRAVNEGEMSLAQANKEKRKVKLTSGSPIDEIVLKGLPSRLRDLILRSNRLQEKVRRLDATIHAPPAADSIASPVNSQITQLRAAFERSQT
jgi:regulator of CtrA degradation